MPFLIHFITIFSLLLIIQSCGVSGNLRWGQEAREEYVVNLTTLRNPHRSVHEWLQYTEPLLFEHLHEKLLKQNSENQYSSQFSNQFSLLLKQARSICTFLSEKSTMNYIEGLNTCKDHCQESYRASSQPALQSTMNKGGNSIDHKKINYFLSNKFRIKISNHFNDTIMMHRLQSSSCALNLNEDCTRFLNASESLFQARLNDVTCTFESNITDIASIQPKDESMSIFSQLIIFNLQKDFISRMPTNMDKNNVALHSNFLILCQNNVSQDFACSPFSAVYTFQLKDSINSKFTDEIANDYRTTSVVTITPRTAGIVASRPRKLNDIVIPTHFVETLRNAFSDFENFLATSALVVTFVAIGVIIVLLLALLFVICCCCCFCFGVCLFLCCVCIYSRKRIIRSKKQVKILKNKAKKERLTLKREMRSLKKSLEEEAKRKTLEAEVQFNDTLDLQIAHFDSTPVKIFHEMSVQHDVEILEEIEFPSNILEPKTPSKNHHEISIQNDLESEEEVAGHNHTLASPLEMVGSSPGNVDRLLGELQPLVMNILKTSGVLTKLTEAQNTEILDLNLSDQIEQSTITMENISINKSELQTSVAEYNTLPSQNNNNATPDQTNVSTSLFLDEVPRRSSKSIVFSHGSSAKLKAEIEKEYKLQSKKDNDKREGIISESNIQTGLPDSTSSCASALATNTIVLQSPHSTVDQESQLQIQDITSPRNAIPSKNEENADYNNEENSSYKHKNNRNDMNVPPSEKIIDAVLEDRVENEMVDVNAMNNSSSVHNKSNQSSPQVSSISHKSISHKKSRENKLENIDADTSSVVTIINSELSNRPVDISEGRKNRYDADFSSTEAQNTVSLTSQIPLEHFDPNPQQLPLQNLLTFQHAPNAILTYATMNHEGDTPREEYMVQISQPIYHTFSPTSRSGVNSSIHQSNDVFLSSRGRKYTNDPTFKANFKASSSNSSPSRQIVSLNEQHNRIGMPAYVHHPLILNDFSNPIESHPQSNFVGVPSPTVFAPSYYTTQSQFTSRDPFSTISVPQSTKAPQPSRVLHATNVQFSPPVNSQAHESLFHHKMQNVQNVHNMPNMPNMPNISNTPNSKVYHTPMDRKDLVNSTPKQSFSEKVDPVTSQLNVTTFREKLKALFTLYNTTTSPINESQWNMFQLRDDLLFMQVVIHHLQTMKQFEDIQFLSPKEAIRTPSYLGYLLNLYKSELKRINNEC